MAKSKRSAKRRAAERQALLRSKTRPLKVLLLGRVSRGKGGGIARSAQMIIEALTCVGDVARIRNVGEPLVDIPSDTDLIYHYGDLGNIEQQIAAAKEAKLPIIINSTYDSTSDRRRWMYERIDAWTAHYPRVYFVVFTESARTDLTLHRMREHLVVVPKTVRFFVNDRAYSDREGICIGELEKLKRARLVRGMDVKSAVVALRTVLPEASIYAYNQYGAATGAELFKGIKIVAPGDGMATFLSKLRLFVSITSNETFSMVPAEAQSVGTPVLYRPMSQSLSEHFGATAYCFDTPQELALGAAKIYEDERFWNRLSSAGIHNARSKCSAAIGPMLDLAIRKVVFR